jgi:hypothetical protein
VGLEQPFEPHKRFLAENDVVEVVERQAALVETAANGVLRVTGVLLLRVKRSSRAAAII